MGQIQFVNTTRTRDFQHLDILPGLFRLFKGRDKSAGPGGDSRVSIVLYSVHSGLGLIYCLRITEEIIPYV